MKKMTCYEDLVYRGLIKDMTNNEDFIDKLNKGGMTFYIGTDPSADSLHLGHYSSFMTAKRLASYGHHPIVLIGGATGLIGDPRPSAERALISKEAVEKNLKGLEKQIKKLFNNDVEIVNNYDWTKDMGVLDFFRDVGKYINVGYMLNKDIIRRRLETGITYAEFSYTLLQGYDFYYLYTHKNCVMQAAGSDQWGNITTGIELINKKLGKDAYGFTMPLILDSTGKKFGKSEGNALWLDKEKTSPYDLYQYLINSTDDKVEEYLKVFTFLTKSEIDKIMKEQKAHPETRIAQKTLAYEVVKDIHGEEDAESSKEKAESIFSGDSNSVDKIETNIKLPINILDLLMETKLFPSKSEAKRMVLQNAISINKNKINDPTLIVDESYNEDGILVQKGKKNFIKLIIK